MKEIGRILREKHEQMNVSLERFFAKVYYKSFVRSYAKYLGFDPEKLIERYDADERNLDNYK
ncbi:hypothetical protein AGMMS49592_4900 [Endomicrobiia bacterium]|nr:hypothetical protein AGMMS49592_4900 [Endomicrobiia bacterium]